MYGLSLYQMHKLSAAGRVNLFIGLLQDRALHDEAEAGIDVSSVPLPPDTDRDAQMRQIMERLAAAAKTGDPAAQSMLGKEYWSEAIRFSSLSAVMNSSTVSQDRMQAYGSKAGVALLRTLTWSCDRAKHLLTQAAQQNWPDSYVDLGLMYASTALIPLTADSGCMTSNPTYADQLAAKAAELGSATARWMLREKYLKQGRSADAALWDGRLKALADEGDREAQDLIPLHTR
jgi:TPR repeat protein